MLLNCGKNSKLYKQSQNDQFQSGDSRGTTKTKDTAIYLDRDPVIFEIIINYLRNDKKEFPKFIHRRERELFRQELEYWEIAYNQEKWNQEDHLYPVNNIDQNASTVFSKFNEKHINMNQNEALQSLNVSGINSAMSARDHINQTSTT